MFSSHRSFKLWDCCVSHNQVLIRSPQTSQLSTNIDLVFWGVELLSVPTTFDGLQLVRGASTKDAGLEFSPSASGEVFLITSRSYTFAVVAAGVKVLENTLDIFESSLERFAATDENRDLGILLAHS